jgi:hypothetical protein
VRAFAATLALAATLTAAAGSSAAPSTAKLRIVDLAPVTVEGLGFRPGERVRVVLRADGNYVRTVRAVRSGRFLARFGAVYAELCTAFQLRATRPSGAVVIATRKPPPSCAALDPVP